MSSPSPSSSAVTIPTPGKSILKRPPPPQQSFFSLARLSKLLPTPNQPANAVSDEATTALKRAHFILPEMTTVYPISAVNPPSTPALKEEKRSIEEREAERRRKIVRGNSLGPDCNFPEEWWNLDKVESFYRECCVGREEAPDAGISAAFKHAAGTNPRTMDLSGVQLTMGSASVLSDVFTIEWGLRKLVFKECDLDEHVLKPILHALLIPDSLTFISVSSNRRLKAPAFRLLGAYVSQAKSLQFLDLSQNPLDKKSIEYISAALPEAPASGLVSLRLDDCSLKPAALDVLANAVRKSSLRNISLRHNRISVTGAVALALMTKDYPDRYPLANGSSSPSSPIPSSNPSSIFLSPPPTPMMSAGSLPSANGTVTPPPRLGPVLPPPRHPSTAPQTTYTPYVPRARRGATSANTNPLSLTGQPVPIITSSAQGGVTARHPVPSPLPAPPTPTHALGTTQPHHQGPSAALLDKVRALDNLPRLGALRTLDLRGNDIRTGINYIAQVLKRNRTLKVLNLSENKLDVQGLIAIAEALKYNSSLETLDLSKNPCCGPGLEGIQSLRTAFTLNDALKRLFLSSTNMMSAGAIALAEFLPESTSLLHLDLTMNNLELAGVMALSSGLKANHTMRCLDLNIPPTDEEMARMCRDILETCARNTEEAERSSRASSVNGSSGRGQAKGVWGMLEESELAKSIRQDDKKKVEEPSDPSPVRARSPADVPPSSAPQSESDVVLRARACKDQLQDVLVRSPSSPSVSDFPVQDGIAELAERTQEMQAQLVALIETIADPARLETLLALNDDLTSLLMRCVKTSAGSPLHGLGIRVDTSVSSTGHAINGAEKGDVSEEEAGDEPFTPRVDKGKGRAVPEPQEPEKVLSPTFLISESDDEDGEAHHLTVETDMVSPTIDRSRSWVEEEGEVFRKGTALLGPEEMEGEYDGEELRRELLDAMVERPPPRAVVDDFSSFGQEVPLEISSQSPVSPQDSIPFELKKPPPRPYIRRSRSSSSVTATPTDETPPVSFEERQTGASSARPRSPSPLSPSSVQKKPILLSSSSKDSD